jgi:hypothetical protein
MFYLTVHAAASSSDPEHGGAHISCWIETADAEEAELSARRFLRGEGWIPLEVVELRTVVWSDYLGSESLRYYDEAERDSACFVFHVYPPE